MQGGWEPTSPRLGRRNRRRAAHSARGSSWPQLALVDPLRQLASYCVAGRARLRSTQSLSCASNMRRLVFATTKCVGPGGRAPTL